MTDKSIFRTQTVITVDAFDLDTFIAKAYGLDNFECSLESPNDSSHTFTVEAKPLDEWTTKAVAEFIGRKSCEIYSLGGILDDLCLKGEVEPGDYIVSVCW